MKIFSQIIAVFLGSVVFFKTYYDFRKKRESIAMFIFWQILWLIVIFVALDPMPFYELMRKSSHYNIGAGTFLGIGFIFLLFITYKLYAKVNELEYEIKSMVTKLALKDFKK